MLLGAGVGGATSCEGSYGSAGALETVASAGTYRHGRGEMRGAPVENGLESARKPIFSLDAYVRSHDVDRIIKSSAMGCAFERWPTASNSSRSQRRGETTTTTPYSVASSYISTTTV